MNEETAKALTEAMNLLAAAIENISAPNGTLQRGINIFHHNAPTGPYQTPQTYPTYYQIPTHYQTGPWL
ncbi:MAG: hypothetical protein EPO08_21430 [Rhodospirillaceae bacterium]|nr:MAG: hypothetical protein EPO08_21430 [Rhodospirillaceae bacterium]